MAVVGRWQTVQGAGIELRALKALRSRGLPEAGIAASGIATGHDAGHEADAEPTLSLDALHTDFEPELERHAESARFYRADPFT